MTRYDENGFDIQGFHRENGSKYNEAGCSREGRDASGNVCDPASVNPLAQAFIDSVATGLPVLVDNLLADTLAGLQNLLQQQTQTCNDLRAEIETLITLLEFDEQYIKGDSNQYFAPGLSEAFAERPQAFLLNVDRDENVEALESKHIALEDCDVYELEYKDLESRLVGADAGAVTDYLITHLSYLGANDVTALQNPENFVVWVREKINQYFADQRDPANATGSNEQTLPGANLFYEPPQQDFNVLATMAGNLDVTAGLDEKELVLYELNSQFKQGFLEIQGVHRAHFLSRLAEIREEENDPERSNLLPITVSKYIGGLKYTILLDAVSLTAGAGATLNAYLVFEDPETGQKLVFQALDANFGPGGLATSSRLALASTVGLRISNTTKLILDKDLTYADWDCTGFQGLSVAGKIELCRNFITPLQEGTLEPLPDPERFHLSFSTYVSEWLDAVVTLDADPFAITGNEDIKWELDSLVVDLSDRQSIQFTPPEGYSSEHYGGEGFSPQWRGVYAANISATLPNDFSASGEDISIGVEDILFDGTGFSGEAYVDDIDILPLESGSAGGWPFSIDRFHLRVLHNQLSGGGFGGLINVPVFTENLRYDATIYKNNRYQFSVQPDSVLSMDMLLAKVELDSNTRIDIAYDEDGLLAVADMTGNLRFDVPDSSSISLKMPELHFQNLRVSNRDPYFDAGIWHIYDLGVKLDFGGFAMDLSKINPQRG
ncbi:MAG: hypothetical protein AAFN92_10790, partial [Bacteroidota bacterium]